MAALKPKVEDKRSLRIGWRLSVNHDNFYKFVNGYAEGEYVFEILSNFSTFLGYHDSTGILEEWNEEERKWIRKT